MAKFSLLDLTVAQVEAIEVRSETSVSHWNSPKASKAAVFGSILVELDGMDPAVVGDMKLRDLMENIKRVIDLEPATDDAQAAEGDGG